MGFWPRRGAQVTGTVRPWVNSAANADLRERWGGGLGLCVSPLSSWRAPQNPTFQQLSLWINKNFLKCRQPKIKNLTPRLNILGSKVPSWQRRRPHRELGGGRKKRSCVQPVAPNFFLWSALGVWDYLSLMGWPLFLLRTPGSFGRAISEV